MTSATEIEAKLIEQLERMGASSADGLSGESALKQLGMDSMRLVELFVFVEKELGFELMNSSVSAKDMETVGSLAVFIAANLD